jgi:hypothetical protein
MSNFDEVRYPDIVPDKITKRMFHVIESSDLRSKDELQSLITLIYMYPEREFYLFQEMGHAGNAFYEEAGISTGETEFHYYRHPSFERDYVRIKAHEGQYAFDWEKDVVEKGPMFMRSKLRLAEQKQREIEILQKIEMERVHDDDPLEIKLGIMGISFDVRKALRRWSIWPRNRDKTK